MNEWMNEWLNELMEMWGVCSRMGEANPQFETQQTCEAHNKFLMWPKFMFLCLFCLLTWIATVGDGLKELKDTLKIIQLVQGKTPLGRVNIRMGNHSGVAVLYALGSQVGVVFHIYTSHLCDRMWAEFQSFSTWFDGFPPGTPVFLPLQNRPLVKNIWPECCAPESCMTVWRQPEAPFICIRPIPSELRPSQFGLRAARKGD